MRSEREKSNLKRKIILESDTEEEAEGSERKEEDVYTDSEWEEDEEETKTSEYNTVKLLNFSHEVNRYGISNRAAAKIGKGLLKDFKLVTKKNTKFLLSPCKVRRERAKWGRVCEKNHRAASLPNGLYLDGKKCPTLTQVSNTVQVQRRGARGRGSRKIIETTSVSKVPTEHFTIVSQQVANTSHT